MGVDVPEYRLSDRIAKERLGNMFLAGYTLSSGCDVACVIAVPSAKVKKFTSNKPGDRYNPLDFGEALAFGIDGVFSEETRKVFELKFDYTLPKKVTWDKKKTDYPRIWQE
jgi:hypothetical protein